MIHMAISDSHDRQIPRAMIHKRILDVAEESPDASIDDLATAVSGASADLVERVLEEYGDPARETPSDPSSKATTQTSQPAEEVRANLSEKQLETLRTIYEHPTASQREIAAELGVTHTTVYHRVQALDGFEWDDRWAFVSALFEEVEHDCRTAIDRMLDRCAGDATLDGSDGAGPVFSNPELTRKIIHACMESGAIGDEEVHVIVDDFLPRTITAHEASVE